MDYEQFSQDVTATTAAKRAVNEFAKKQKDGVHICPRCGQLTVKERLVTNAFSRHADVYICDACGMDEAVRDMKGDPMPLKDWAIARIPRQTEKWRFIAVASRKPSLSFIRLLQHPVRHSGG